MNTNNEENNITQDINTNPIPNEVGNIDPNNMVPEPPVQEVVEQPMEAPLPPVGEPVETAPVETPVETVSEQPVESAPVEQPAEQQPAGPQEVQPKKKSNVVAIIIVILFIGAAGYFLYNKFFAGNNSGGSSSLGGGSCIEDFKSEGSMSLNGQMAVASGDTQYIFDSSFNTDFISAAMDFEDVKLKLCYKSGNASANFHVGSTTNSKNVESYELYNRTNNSKINATDIGGLLKELGYHAFGQYTEEATLIEIDSYPGFGFSNGETYTNYDVKIKLSSGKEVEATYRVGEGQTDRHSELEANKQYTFDFEVQEDTFDAFKYVITDFR